MNRNTPAKINHPKRILTAPEFHQLAQVPPEAEWLANITNEHTRRAYRNSVSEFADFVGLAHLEEFRQVTRAHVIAWRDALIATEAAPATLRAKLSALSSLFDYLCDKNAVPNNPVKGVKRPAEGSNEGKTPALSDAQARKLLSSPTPDTVAGLRDAAIISVALHHGLRRAEIASLNVNDIIQPRGIAHLRVKGKRGKVRSVELHPATAEALHDYLAAAGHAEDKKSPLFRPVRNNVTKELVKPLHPQSVAAIIKRHAKNVGIDPESFSAHSCRVTAGTKAHENGAELRELRDWYGHASVATTSLYIRRRYDTADSPTFKTNY